VKRLVCLLGPEVGTGWRSRHPTSSRVLPAGFAG
jgi:hypothetical protein